MLSTRKTARKRCSAPTLGSGSRLVTATCGGAIPRCASEAPNGAPLSKITAMNAVTIRISLSYGALEVGADDLPVSAVVDELELEAIEIGVQAVDQLGVRAPADHAGMHDGARGVPAFDDDLVDAAHDLDPPVGDAVTAQHPKRLGAVGAARIAIVLAEGVAKKTDVARLGRLFRGGEHRTNLGFRIAGSAARGEHGEQTSKAPRFHGGDCKVPISART